MEDELVGEEESTVKWETLAQRIGYWTVPPGIQDFVRRQRARRVSNPAPCAAMEAEFARNIKFRNIHEGERCFILATGPSINKQDLKLLKNEVCFAVSHFYLHKDIGEIDPMYYIDAPNHPPYGFEEFVRPNLMAFGKSFSSRTTYFFGHNFYEYSYFNFLQQNPQFKKKNIYYLNYCNSPTLDESNYNNPDLWDICRPLFGPRTVIYCAIQVAAYMGFKKIYLLGCDHDYLLNIARKHSVHFYKEEEGLDDSDDWPSTEEFFLAYYLRWKQYRLMRSYLESRGCYIYNATEGGLLDVFPRVSLAEALTSHHE